LLDNNIQKADTFHTSMARCKKATSIHFLYLPRKSSLIGYIYGLWLSTYHVQLCSLQTTCIKLSTRWSSRIRHSPEQRQYAETVLMNRK